MVNDKLKLKDLKDVMAVFEKFNVKAFLSYGAVLGAVRDKNFIEWDDDIDIDVIDRIDLPTRKKIGSTLASLGFQTQPICFNVFGTMEMVVSAPYGGCAYDGDDETGIIVCERNFKFSIFFYKQEADEFVCTPKRGGMRLISNLTKFYERPDTVKLHGEKFYCPGPVKDYLTYMYGDWKTPKKENAHAPQWNARHLSN